MHAHRTPSAALTGLLVAAVLLVGPPTGASPAESNDTVAPVLTNAKVKPKVLPSPGRALVVVTSSEPARLKGSVLIKQDGRWNRTSIEREWKLDRGRNELSFLSREEQSLLVEAKYRLRLRAVDDADNKSAKVIVEFQVDLRH